MAILQLNNGYATTFNDEHYERVVNSGYHWRAKQVKKTGYWRVVGIKFLYKITSPISGKPSYKVQSILLHRFLKPNITNMIDHKDGNTFNNYDENLRPASAKQNAANKKKAPGCSSQYIGVYWFKSNKKWRAAINIDGKKTHLGLFNSEVEAATSYNIAASKPEPEGFGEYANLNMIRRI